MNDFYETNATRTESRKTHSAELLAQFADDLPKPSDLTEELGTQKYPARGKGRNMRNPRTVFYVDDNPKALRMLTFALEGSGYKVVTACDGREALERMEQGAFDLVLLSHRMPKMIGSELAREIKRFSPATPIFLVSGHTLLAAEELTYVDAYVGKGATLDSLLTKMQALIGRT